jgi:hypothetical protein
VTKRHVSRQRVFISHISDETDVAQWLKAKLERDFLGALDIFVSSDRLTIEAGRRWLDEVDKALKAADLQIVLCSRASVGRPWVNFEAGAVWLRGIPVVPVCHSGMRVEDLPAPLSMLEAIAIGDPAGLAKLYDAVAGTLGLNTPAPDFAALAAEARDIEAKHLRAATRVPVIEKPRVLCAASADYAQPQYGFDLDVAVVEKHFPGRVTVDRALTSASLLDRLTTERFDIIHLVTAVDPETGSLIFDPVDPATRLPAAGADTMTPSAFAALLVETQARLVVLGTCKALLLAVEVATVANMAASDQDITGEDAAAWEDCFYGLLVKGKSVFKAFELVKAQRRTPIRAVRHQDVQFA